MYGRIKINPSTIHIYTFSHQESQIRVLAKEDFNVGSGPFVQALDKALKTFNVERPTTHYNCKPTLIVDWTHLSPKKLAAFRLPF